MIYAHTSVHAYKGIYAHTHKHKHPRAYTHMYVHLYKHILYIYIYTDMPVEHISIYIYIIYTNHIYISF